MKFEKINNKGQAQLFKNQYLEMLTKTLAIEWADRNVRVNAVAPGYFATEMTAGLSPDHTEEVGRSKLSSA